jgi:hypothetical protein
VTHCRLEEIADGVLAAISRPEGDGRGNAAIARLDAWGSETLPPPQV